MLTLHMGPRAWGVPNVSPFCIKLEAYLRMAHVPYEAKVADIRKAPKGKVPFIEFEGQKLGDSTHIIDFLRKRFGDPLDSRLTPEQRAQGWALQRMLEEGTYWVDIFHRWATENFPVVRDATIAHLGLPRPAVSLLGSVLQRNVLRSLWGQGTSRHKPEEIYEMGRRDFAAASALLGEGLYLFGEAPSSFDAVLFAFTVAAFRTPFASKYGPCPQNLAAHADRILQRYFADLT